MRPTRTSLVILANTLTDGRGYWADIHFVKTTTINRNSYPGVVGIAGYDHYTEFNIQAASVGPATPDVIFYGVYKGRVFTQTNQAAPALGSGKPYFGGAMVIPMATNSVTDATLQLPIGFSKPLAWNPTIGLYGLTDYFADRTSLDTLYSSGNYTLTINTVHDGTKTQSLAMAGDQNPEPAQISNFAAAQAINAASDFVLTWNPVAGVTANDRFRFYLYESPARNVLVTSARLDSTGNSVLIPANTLKPGQNYQAMLFFIKVAAPGDNSYPGVASDVSFFARTDFLISTAVAAGPRFTLAQILPDGTRRFQVTGVAGRTMPLEATSDFREWSLLGTMTVPTDPANFFDGETPMPGYRFYRVVIP